jgi:hypothetical protein
MKAEEVRRTCTFIVTASSQAEGTATINHCSLAHTCDFMSSSYEKRNVSRKILKASHSSVLNNAVIPSITTSKKSFFAKSLSQSVMNEGRVEISVEQTRRFLRDKTGDTAEEHIQQFSIIESFEYYSDKLRKLISSKSFDYLEERKQDFCFVELRQRGLLTNYGCVSNNASESTNACLPREGE